LLDEQCGSDQAVRREVELLLDRFDEPTVSSLQAVDLLDRVEVTLVGECIGPYKTLRLLGERGFGSVYLAEQSEPVRRTVALKIIKPGMDSRQIVGRFEAERQALATMDHPHIAKVFDAGSTDAGRPYFAMEFVDGVPITEFCDEHNLPTRKRLELFIQVCRAVQHAHQKGIIHRDIKPSNILVTLHDDVPIPKIIDFGIAKAIHEPLTDRTLVTNIRQFVGTPEYVSPEQAEMSELGVDTRTDVYSLGVILYELLTGATPFARSKQHSTTYADILRVIREEVPDTPSRRLSAVATACTEVGGSRRAEIRVLSRLVRGDLDWITMKALEKDRARRYETAAALATDVERHLNNEAVSAGPPSAIYQLRKLAARHKTASVFAATVFVLVTGFGIWMSMLYAESNVFRLRAERQRSVAEANLSRAHKAEERAETEASFLREVLTSVDPGKALGREVSVRFVLDQAASRIHEGWLEKQPEAQAAVQLTIGETYTSLGLYRAAESHLGAALGTYQRRLGPEHPETLRALYAMGNLVRTQGAFSEAEEILRPVWETQVRVLGSDHPATLKSANALGTTLWRPGRYAEAERIHRETLSAQRRVLGSENIATLGSMSNLGNALQGQEKCEEAEKVLRECLEIGRRVLDEGHPFIARATNNLALVLETQGRHAEAEELFRASLKMNRHVLSSEHPKTRIPAHNLLRVLRAQGKWEELRFHASEQISYERKAAERADASIGELHVYAWTLLTCEPADLRDPDAAIPFAKRAVELSEGRYPDILDTLALAYRMTGDIDSAIETQRKAVEIASPSRSSDPSGVRRRLIEYLCEKGAYLEAGDVHGRLLAGDLGISEVNREQAAGSLLAYSRESSDRGDYPEAERLLRMSLALQEQGVLPEHSQLVETLRLLGTTLATQGKFEEAETLLLRCYAHATAVDGSGHERCLDAIRSITNLYEAWGRPHEAAKWRATLVTEKNQ